MRGLRRASPWLIAGVLLGLSGFVAQIISARSLSVAENKQFLVFFSLILALTGSLSGIQGETSRAMTVTGGPGPAADDPGDPGRHRGATITGANPARDGRAAPGAPLLTSVLGVGAALAAGVGLGAAAWLPAFLPGSSALTLALVTGALVAYAGESAAVGGLIGRDRANPAASIVGAEALGRMGLVAGAAGLGTGLVSFQVATVVPMLLWCVVLAASGTWSEAWSMRVSEPLPVFVRHCLFAIGGGACTSFLVNGYPAFLAATSHTVDARDLTPVMNAITLTRAPLLLPLLAFQGLVVSFLIRNAHHLGATLGRLFAALWGFAAIVAAGVWLFGPWFIATVYGPGYALDGLVLALLTVGAACTATLVAAAASAMALGRHRRYLLAWVVGTALAFVLLLLPGTLLARVMTSLIVGPLAGAGVALIGLRGRARFGRTRGVA